MSPIELTHEAEECRKLAPEFRGRPEQPFLLQLAIAFEELALTEVHRSGKSTSKARSTS